MDCEKIGRWRSRTVSGAVDVSSPEVFKLNSEPLQECKVKLAIAEVNVYEITEL